jgi:hypothetical protein
MAVANTSSMDTQVALIAFAANETANPDAVVVVNWSEEDKKISMKLKNTTFNTFEAFRTTEDEKDLYNRIGYYEISEGRILFDAPKGSVTTFFGIKR